MKSKNGIFYGWWVILASMIILMINGGYLIYSFSLFVKPLAGEMGFSRSQVVGGFTTFVILVALISPMCGRFIEKRGVKKSLYIGGVFFIIGYTILSKLNSFPMYVAGYALLSVAAVFTGPLLVSVLATYWFEKKRGTALGVGSIGIGLGGFILAPTIAKYILPEFGWRGSYMALGVSACVITLFLAKFVIKDKPSDIGLFPDGALEKDEKAEVTKLVGMSRKQASKTSAFWALVVGFFFFGFVTFGVLQNQVPHLSDIGIDLVMAAGALGTIGMMSALGKFVFGWLCDILPIKIISTIGTVLLLFGVVLLMSINANSSKFLIYAYAVVFGLGVGAWMPIMSIQIAANFGTKYFASIYGLIFMFKAIAESIGPLAAANIFDRTGSYTGIFTFFIIAAGISLVAFLFVKKPNEMIKIIEESNEHLAE